MRIDIACFTERGRTLGERLERELRGDGDTVRLVRCGPGVPVVQWVAERFHDTDALVFIGAAGIAVRALAPAIVSKTSDPAVVVADDGGRFAVSLLSGHIGGANELAERIGTLIGAVPVITTATDAGGVFAIDVWATKKDMRIANPERIKIVSAKLLAGGIVRIRSAFPVAGDPPDGVILTSGDSDVIVDCRAAGEPEGLHLIPRAATLGIGCRKNTTVEAIEKAFQHFCETSGVCRQAFEKVCSIDRKRDEPGLVAFCGKHGLPFETFAAETLAGAKGDFISSDFVAAVTGVDNVCERSAVMGSRGGTLAVGKAVVGGIAMAAAFRAYTVNFGNDGEDGV